INLDVDLATGIFIAGKTRLADAALVGRVAGREITVDRFAFALAGGGVTASGSAEPAEGGARLSLDAALRGLDAAEMAAMIGAAAAPPAGDPRRRGAAPASPATRRYGGWTQPRWRR